MTTRLGPRWLRLTVAPSWPPAPSRTSSAISARNAERVGVEEVAERLLAVAAGVQQRGDLVQQAQVLLLLAGAGVGAVGRRR